MKSMLLSLAVAILFATSAFAKIIHVPADQPTIQAAINAAAKGDTVLVADGTYYENINFKGKTITVASHFLMDADTSHISKTIINGSKPSHPDSGSVVYFVSGEDTASVLCGLTITNGSGTMYVPYSAQVGGGIFCDNSGCTLLANKIINNKLTYATAYGAGLAAMPMGSLATVILKDNHIIHNTLTTNAGNAYGGGVALRLNGKLVNNQISYNTIIQNATDKQAISGGVDAYCLNLIMESNKITHNSIVSYSELDANTAFGGGGTIRGGGRLTKNEVSHNQIWIKPAKNAVGGGLQFNNVADSFIIEGNHIHDNTITNGNGWGGGIGLYNSSPLIINNIFAGNSVTYVGGGLFITQNVKAQLINNTIINNKAGEHGGGLSLRSTAAPVLINTIIWNNQAPDKAAIYIDVSEGASVQADYCDIQGGWSSGAGNINADPLFVNTKFHLADASPCIDKGNPDAIYNDPEDASNPGLALFPARGTVKNDMGAFGGPGARKTITAVKHDRSTNEAQPNTFVLFQNYPNPFNPTTTIEFELPNSDFVTLKVYNLLGREVATLAEQKLAAGRHQFEWDARRFVSGVYFYKIEASNFSMTRMMLLVR